MVENYMRENVNWDKLKVFYFVANCCNISAAAIKLNTTQPSISRKILILERQLKTQLFYRTSRGLEITEAGKEIYGLVKNFMSQLEGARTMHNLKQTTGKFKISTTIGALERWLSISVIPKLIEKYPQISFEVIGHYDNLDLFSGESDVAILPVPQEYPQDKREGLCYDYLFERHWGFFASKKYIEKYGEPKTVEDLDKHKIIIMSQAFQYSAHRQHKNLYAWPLIIGMPEGKARKPILETSSDIAIINAALEGVGIFGAIKEWPFLKNYPDIKPILPELSKSFSFYYIYPEQVKDAPFIRELYNVLKENQ